MVRVGLNMLLEDLMSLGQLTCKKGPDKDAVVYWASCRRCITLCLHTACPALTGQLDFTKQGIESVLS